MRSWNISNVPEEEKKGFIISCLSDYIDEVDSLEMDGDVIDREIIDIRNLYEEVIRLLIHG